ncbi:MAG: hypothetical protein ACRCYQ_12045 [Nocardioides sp.]
MSRPHQAIDGTRPIALGYFREDAPMSDPEVAKATTAMAAFAESEGYELGTVYVERVDRTPEAFEALLASASAIGEAAVAVIVPGPHRVMAIGATSTIQTTTCPPDAPTIPRTGEAGVASNHAQPHVEGRARLAVPTGSPRHRDHNSIPGTGAAAEDSLDRAVSERGDLG